MWINQYLTLFFIEHFKFISICFAVLKRSVLEHRYKYAKGYTELTFYGRHFVLKRTRQSFIYHWIGSEKGIMHFTFTVIVCPATGPGYLKFITDSLPLFGLIETFLIAKSEASMMWGDAMPHEMNEFIKSFSCTPLKKHARLWNKIYHFWSSVCLFFTIVKGNSCLFETCV